MKHWLIGIPTSCLLALGPLAPPSLQASDSLLDLSKRTQLEKRGPVLIAHRGGVIRDDSPECSLQAIRLAAKAGYAMVELDIQRSRDDVPIVFHDDTLKQACGVKGEIDDYSAADLAKIPYRGSNQKIVSLDSALSLCRELHLGVMLDLKGGRDHPQFLRKIDKMIVAQSLSKAVVSISGTPAARDALRHVIFTITNEQMAQFRKGQQVDLRGTFWFGLPNRLPSADVARLQKSGALVFPAINTFRYPKDRHLELARKDMERLVSAGVDGFQIDSVYAELLKKK